MAADTAEAQAAIAAIAERQRQEQRADKLAAEQRSWQQQEAEREHQRKMTYQQFLTSLKSSDSASEKSSSGVKYPLTLNQAIDAWSRGVKTQPVADTLNAYYGAGVYQVPVRNINPLTGASATTQTPWANLNDYVEFLAQSGYSAEEASEIVRRQLGR